MNTKLYALLFSTFACLQAIAQVPLAIVERVHNGPVTMSFDDLPGVEIPLKEGVALRRNSKVNFDTGSEHPTLCVRWLLETEEHSEQLCADCVLEPERVHYQIDNWHPSVGTRESHVELEDSMTRMLYFAGRTRGGDNLLYRPANGASIDARNALALAWRLASSAEVAVLEVLDDSGELVWTAEAAMASGRLSSSELPTLLRAARENGARNFWFSCMPKESWESPVYNQCVLLSDADLVGLDGALASCAELPSPWDRMTRASVYYESKLFGAAVTELKETLKHEELPNRIEILNTLIRIHHEVGNLAAAKQAKVSLEESFPATSPPK